VKSHRTGKQTPGWADPVSWGPWQIAVFLGVVVLLTLFAFRAVGG
jgi:hypothetical protein